MAGTTTSAATDLSKSDADLVYLNTERKKLASELSQCRLFSIRAKDAVEAYTLTINKLKHQETFARGQPLWTIISNLQALPAGTISNSFSMSSLFDTFSLNWLLFSLSISVLVAGLLIVSIKKNKHVRHYLRVRSFHFFTWIMLSLCLWFTSLSIMLTYDINQLTIEHGLLLKSLKLLSLYTLGLLTIGLLFNFKRIRAFFYWYSLDSLFFKSLMLFLFSFYAISFLAQDIATRLNIHTLLWQLSTTIFLMAVLAIAIVFVYYFCHTHRHIPLIRKRHRLIQRLCVLLFLICGGVDVWGYYTLALHLTFATISTFAVIFGTWLIDQALNKIYLACTHFGAWHNTVN